MPRRIEYTDDQGRTWTAPHPNMEQRTKYGDQYEPSPPSERMSVPPGSPADTKATPAARAASSPPATTQVPELSVKNFPPLPSLPTTPTEPTQLSPRSRLRSLVPSLSGPGPAPNAAPPLNSNPKAQRTTKAFEHTPASTNATSMAASQNLGQAAYQANPLTTSQEAPDEPQSSLAIPGPTQPLVPYDPSPPFTSLASVPEQRAPSFHDREPSARAPSPSSTHTRKRRRAGSNPPLSYLSLDVPWSQNDTPANSAPTQRTDSQPQPAEPEDNDMSIDRSNTSSPDTNAANWGSPAHPPDPLPSPTPQDGERAIIPAAIIPAFRQHGDSARIFPSSLWLPWLRLNPAQERVWQRALAPGEQRKVLFVTEYARTETAGVASADRITADLSTALQRPEDNLVDVSYPHPIPALPGAQQPRPSVWHFVYDLSAEEQCALLNAGVISRDGRAYIFLPANLDTTQPVFLYALRGLRGTLDDLTPHILQCIFNSAAVRELCSNYADNPLVDDFLTNIRIDELAMRDSDSRPTRAIRIYARLPMIDPTEQQAIRDSLRTVNFDHPFHGAVRLEAYLCTHCQGSDHPSGLCPLPTLLGWQGPNPFTPTATDQALANLPPAVLPAAPQSLTNEQGSGRGNRGRARARGGGRGRGRGRGRGN
ncbi:hypothetical protein K488DRAFT_69934 [Vararia minispora EC-137]|uniref:Uncharacterized protein n=1 Tax=Vararia minispora EC-137 TaxID=1314806 RepID=A0ACB8QN77_9AGAM|nr:hypothetical protein K488DRAFT_69934 [Vararia minispora EC-137]